MARPTQVAPGRARIWPQAHGTPDSLATFAQFSHRARLRSTWPAESCSFGRDLPALSLWSDLGLGNNFLDTAPKAQRTKGRIDILDFKIKKFCALMNTLEKMRRQPKEWEKNIHK